jgi:hypothetical protein
VDARSDHQDVVRDVNNRIRELLERFGTSSGEFFCECDRDDCRERMVVPLGDYDAVRAGGDARFLLASTHDPS